MRACVLEFARLGPNIENWAIKIWRRVHDQLRPHDQRYINSLWPGGLVKMGHFNTILTSPKSWLSQEDLDASYIHRCPWTLKGLTFNVDYQMLKVKNSTLLSQKKWKKGGNFYHGCKKIELCSIFLQPSVVVWLDFHQNFVLYRIKVISGRLWSFSPHNPWKG